jgi:hypothetical protein
MPRPCPAPASRPGPGAPAAGEHGRTVFFQNEKAYDAPNQAAIQNGSVKGYAAYRVGEAVTSHEGWGLGSYCYYNVDPTIVQHHGFAAPNRPGVRFHDLLVVSLGGNGQYERVINDTGSPTSGEVHGAVDGGVVPVARGAGRAPSLRIRKEGLAASAVGAGRRDRRRFRCVTGGRWRRPVGDDGGGSWRMADGRWPVPGGRGPVAGEGSRLLEAAAV